MSPPPFGVEMQLTRHGEALRSLAGELVRDPALADDAVQEVWLGAMQRPPKHDAALGGWFATALRNVVRGWLRRDRRRVRREVDAVSLRDDFAEDHAVVAAREEQARRLLAAVTQLDAPFREAIWQRYFEGKAPREIAAASAVPLATVKSRLQRGLGMLREQLGERDRGDWRAGLVAAFGLEPGASSGVVAAVGTAWTGGILMTAWMKSVAAGVVVAGAGLLWWTLREPGSPVPVADVSAPAGADAAVADLAAQPVVKTEPSATPTVAERTPAQPTIAPAAAKNATLRGRCVDEQGVPLAGCKLRLEGWAAGGERQDAWLRDRGALPDWPAPSPCTTGNDGVFSFEFWPPPPFRFVLDATLEGRATMRGTWPHIAEGAALDLGDVVFGAGVRVAGRVVTSAGQPLPNVRLSFDRVVAMSQRDKDLGRLVVAYDLSASTDAGGRFALADWLAEGAYTVEVLGHDAVQPKRLELAVGRRSDDLEFVVTIPDAGPEPTISGRVVDEADRSVRRARVEAVDVRGPNSTETDRDGKFVLKRRRDSKATAAVLRAVCDGYEPTESEQPVAWGATGVVLRQQSGGVLTLRVTDEAGQPVERFTVRLLRIAARGGSSRDHRVRSQGLHADGTATIPGITMGQWVAVVEFPADTGWQPCHAPFEAGKQAAVRIDLRADAVATRPLRVVTKDGAPVAGSKVQLADPVEGPLDEHSLVLGLEQYMRTHGARKALAVFDGTTDADGRLPLRGRTDRPLTLLLLGPGHLPLRLAGVRLDAADELLVTVEQGARLRGRLAPPEALAELRRLGELGAEGPFQGPASQWPCLSLWTGTEPRVVRLPGPNELPFGIAPDGTFDLRGVPSGSWKVHLNYYEKREGAIAPKLRYCSTVALVEGRDTEVSLDLEAILPGTLEGVVTRNGAPLANEWIALEGDLGTQPDGRPATDWVRIATDAEGRFVHQGPPGEYGLKLHRAVDKKAIPFLGATTTARIERGVVTKHVFALYSGQLRLMVRDPAGHPAADLALLVLPDGQRLPPTGADGTTTAELTARATTVRVLPKRLQTPEAQAKVWREGEAAGQSDPLAPFWITLGEATVVAGQTTTLELRLPPEWEK